MCVGRVKLYSSLQCYSTSVHESIYIFTKGPSVWPDVLIDNNVNLNILFFCPVISAADLSVKYRLSHAPV